MVTSPLLTPPLLTDPRRAGRNTMCTLRGGLGKEGEGNPGPLSSPHHPSFHTCPLSRPVVWVGFGWLETKKAPKKEAGRIPDHLNPLLRPKSGVRTALPPSLAPWPPAFVKVVLRPPLRIEEWPHNNRFPSTFVPVKLLLSPWFLRCRSTSNCALRCTSGSGSSMARSPGDHNNI